MITSAGIARPGTSGWSTVTEPPDDLARKCGECTEDGLGNCQYGCRQGQPAVFVLLVEWDHEGRQLLAASDSLAAAQAASTGYLELQNSQPAGGWQAEDVRPGDIFSAGATAGWLLEVSSAERLIVLQVPVVTG